MLYAARAGTLLFFMFAAALVWTRTRDWLGEGYAAVAVGLFCLSPPVVAHASLATTDASMMAMYFWMLDRLWRLARERTARNAVWAGVVTGLALVSKMTAAPYLFASMVLLVLLGRMYGRGRAWSWRRHLPGWRMGALAVGVCSVVVWGMYFFSVGSLVPVGEEDRGKLTTLMQRHHLPAGPLLAVLDHLPAPDYFAGLRAARALDHHAGAKYFMGRLRAGGDKRFFPVMYATKMTLPMLMLSLGGLGLALDGMWRRRDAYFVLLVVGFSVPFLVGMTAHVNIGFRHLLGVVPFAAMLGAFAVKRMWDARVMWLRAVVGGLLVWHGVDALRAAPDPLPCFNALAIHGGGWMEPDSDFDWGQDLKRLPAALDKLHVGSFAFGYNGSAELGRAGLPPVHLLKPGERATGWVVMSEYNIREAPQDFGWVEAYQPVAMAGQTLRIYWIPAAVTAPMQGAADAGK